jgi:hypothetical protein
MNWAAEAHPRLTIQRAAAACQAPGQLARGNSQCGADRLPSSRRRGNESHSLSENRSLVTSSPTIRMRQPMRM